jgi:SAM-dependent methyltransferase
MRASERETWDRHWQALAGGGSPLFATLASLVRRTILARAVRHYSDRWFPVEGVLVELGCGTAQSSARIRRLRRRFVGVDVSLPALLSARSGGSPHRHLVRADIRSLPFREASIDGAWNLGVMEHFPPAQGHAILREAWRVLRPGGHAILFWPPKFGLSRWVLAPFEWARSRMRGRPFRFFPDEVNRLASCRHARETLRAAGFEPLAADFTARDCFIHVVAVGRRPRG